MATSFYVYSSLEVYNRIYKDFIQDPMFNAKLIDIYIVPRLHLIAVTNTNNQKERLNMNRTIVHARNGVLPEELKGTVDLIKHNQCVFDAKKNKLLFKPRFLRSPLYETKVDRFYGDFHKGKYKVNWEHRFYDFMRDRINLVL